MHRICVILHLYHYLLIDEMHAYISRLGNYEHDVYITVPENSTESQIEGVLAKFPDSTIKRVPNKGLDIGAFFSILQDIDLDKYGVVFKVHTKNSIAGWRKTLLDSILINQDRIKQVVGILMSGKVKMIGSRGWLTTHMGPNHHHFNAFCQRFSYTDFSLKPFVGGTTFACTIDILKEIKSKNIPQEEFEDGYRVDGLKAHAFERMFGKIVHEMGGLIVPM